MEDRLVLADEKIRDFTMDMAESFSLTSEELTQIIWDFLRDLMQVPVIDEEVRFETG